MFIMSKITIKINGASHLPKYLQIEEKVKDLIRSKDLSIGSPLPSIRQICIHNNISQETVLKAYQELKENGIIKSETRKGYYVINDNVDYERNVFLLFDELSEYKKLLYNALRNGLMKTKVNLKIFFHHCDIDVFEAMILNNMDDYNVFVIMPFANERIASILELLHGKDLLLLDRKEDLSETRFNFIVQDFNVSLYDCLQSATYHIKRYKKFILVFPDTDSIASNASKAPNDIKVAFSRYCKDIGLEHEIVSEIKEVGENEAFMVIDDMDLVNLIEMVKNNGFELGRTVGLVSYNDSPLKKVIANGITVVSADFEKMGDKVASYIINGPRSEKEVMSTELILRNSL